MMRIISFILSLAAPLPALALSCVQPSVVATYERAQESTDAYVVVHGRLVVDQRKFLRAGASSQNPAEMTRIPATIEGRALLKTGFNAPFKRGITLEVACFGPWCESVENGADVLAFLRRDAAGYVLAIDPCGGDVFATPQVAMLKQVERCFRRGQC
ncbi:hypothetical protein [Sulfitobacter sp. SK011]|uniref:hypothetical protein n=1 Tax=Sulfitobacter sp. SK011 TaxID=1389004 RepID=UPI000E0B0DBA|nr:hypothetical protein [Sulfitobacter sp. SK011]AXI43845.1 hypothetical protein C1J02_19420 [Sulfitobacter sp. SK011]